jgi:methylated-DNA-[protein]-cysteine S-methyltransferase
MKFEQKVWRLIEKIPRGKVTTYKIIAEKLGTRAYRAVGTACRNNSNAPKVPCHRVVNYDGKIGGYAYGKKNKIQLLASENVKITNGKIENFKEFLFKF